MKSIKAVLAVAAYLCFMSMASAAEITGRVSYLYVDNSGYTLVKVSSATGYLYCYKTGTMTLTNVVLSDASSDQRNNVHLACSSSSEISNLTRQD